MLKKTFESDRTIEQLIVEIPQLASALHFLGIHFLNHTEETLNEICTKRNITLEFLEKNFEKYLFNHQNIPSIQMLSLDLILEYLKHSHYIFIKQRLPFIIDIIKKFEGDFPEIKGELKIVFPLFVEDFVTHIYDEEDTLFVYISLLNNVMNDKSKLNKAQAMMMENSIKHYQSDHEVHDDHLKGLRKLTNEFEIKPEYDLSTKVVLTELKKLDEELRYHAKIENEILFPKALELERKVLGTIRSKIALN